MSSLPAAEGRACEPGAQSAELTSLAVLIPAWQPEQGLVSLVRRLVGAGFGRVLVVDDGSRAECAPVFAAIAEIERVEILRHAANLGKGRALKTGFRHLLELGEDMAGVVTADADGQHPPEDVVRVGEALLGAGERAVLGVRSFSGEVPWRSRVGNAVARRFFALLLGHPVADTQTGLRGLPLAVLPALLRLQGERYEYEMTMLAHLCRAGARPLEVPIATVYLEGNRGSHFHPVWDSLRVYGALVFTSVRGWRARAVKSK